MNTLSIAKKIWLSLAILIAGYMFSTLAGFYLGMKTESQVEIASHTLFPAAIMSNDALTSFEKQIKGYNDAILMGEEDIFKMTKEQADKAITDLRKIISMDNIAKTLQQDMSRTADNLEQFTKTAQTFYAGIAREEMEMDAEKMQALAKQTKDITEKLVFYKDELAKALKNNLKEISHASKSQRTINLFIFLGVVLVSIICAWLIITRAITHPIGRTVAMLKDIAEGEGDLTSRLEMKTRDEIGEVAKWFNTFIANLQELITDFARNAKILNKASQDLVNFADHMSQEAEGLSEKSNSVSISSKDMSDTLNSVAASMEQTAGSISMVATAAEEMNATIAGIAQNTDQVKQISDTAVDQVLGASNKIDSLATSIASISEVTEVITDISEQINLLALNATIEAARAGEAGKGFAVVANEIKDLAFQTAESSANIRDLTQSIQSDTKTAVKDIGQVTEVISTINEKIDSIATTVNEQSQTTSNIASNIAQASQGVQLVNENVSHTSTSAVDINNVINEVNHSGTDISKTSEQVNLSARNLEKMASELQEMVERFKI